MKCVFSFFHLVFAQLKNQAANSPDPLVGSSMGKTSVIIVILLLIMTKKHLHKSCALYNETEAHISMKR